MSGLNTTDYSIAITLDDVTAAGTYALTNTFPLRFAVVTTKPRRKPGRPSPARWR